MQFLSSSILENIRNGGEDLFAQNNICARPCHEISNYCVKP